MKFTFPKSISLFVLLGTFAVDPALADHNSPMGAGTANMPNDIHNTRIEEVMQSDDPMTSEEWREFVSMGAGADTVNEYLEGETLPSETSMNSGVDSPDAVARGGRPESLEPGVSFRAVDVVRPSPGPRAVVSVERPVMATRPSRR